ncbi:hypothetical protein [Proteus vulgaris]|uniref:hypothetical protein n=1 Tax=Proteus vulgaris TaxID=585 RepID=UPI002361E1CD|nr:hypothetical protein [Proteus vulgaris]
MKNEPSQQNNEQSMRYLIPDTDLSPQIKKVKQPTLLNLDFSKILFMEKRRVLK